MADRRRIFTCSHVHEEGAPILLFSNQEGEFSFLCGGPHVQTDCVALGLSHLLDNDPLLEGLLDLPVSWEAERDDPQSVWRRRLILDE